MVWNIVSDSSCDFLPSMFSSDIINFESVPLRIQVGTREFIDNEGLDVPVMLAAMADEKAAASTACPSPAAFARAFEKGEKTLCFTISSNLSGTYNAAVMGRDLLLDEQPGKNVCIIDSRATAGAMVLLIRKTKELIEANPEIDFDELCGLLRMYQASLRQPDQERPYAPSGGHFAPYSGYPCHRRCNATGHHSCGGQGPWRSQDL